MLQEIKNALSLFLVMVVITGVAYPMLITASAKLIFQKEASGSIIKKEDKVIGSELIGQQFSKPGYFHPRLSNAGAGYDAMSSGASNLSPTNTKLQSDVSERFKTLSGDNPGKIVPVDLLTSSASGLDPHISPEAAFFQVSRIAKVRKVAESKVTLLIEKNIEGRFLGIFGEPRVNVLLLNIELDKK